MSAITIGGELVHYEVLGRGRPVILLHGWIGSWRYWVPTMQQLQLKYRVYALDLFGFGDSGKNTGKYTLDQQVQLLTNFLREMGIPKVALIGHGLGALVATEFSWLYSDRVSRLLISSAPLYDTGDLDERVPMGHVNPLTTNATDGEAGEEAVSSGKTNEATLMSASTAMRAALAEAARARTSSAEQPSYLNDQAAPPKPPVMANRLHDNFSGSSLEDLLSRCFKRSEPEFEKLMVDVRKTDKEAVTLSTKTYDAGRTLDVLRSLPMPKVIVHGVDDPIIPNPGENVWNYVMGDQEETTLPVPLSGIRHFPMLEHERFFRLTTDFLDSPDVSKLEIKERWKRRTR